MAPHETQDKSPPSFLPKLPPPPPPPLFDPAPASPGRATLCLHRASLRNKGPPSPQHSIILGSRGDGYTTSRARTAGVTSRQRSRFRYKHSPAHLVSQSLDADHVRDGDFRSHADLRRLFQVAHDLGRSHGPRKNSKQVTIQEQRFSVYTNASNNHKDSDLHTHTHTPLPHRARRHFSLSQKLR